MNRGRDEEVSIATELRVNDRIRASEVRVVAPDGTQVGIKKVEEALWLANELGLDLVEVAPDARPPVCRLMDYGKWKYEQSVKARESRKKQTKTVIKEVKLRPKIDSHDFEVKRRRAERFLNDNDKVKVTLMFRGREITHPEIGDRLLKKMASELEGYGVVENPPKLEGRNMTMVIAPERPSVREETARRRAAEEAGEPYEEPSARTADDAADTGATEAEEPEAPADSAAAS